MVEDLISRITRELEENGNKISPAFIEQLVIESDRLYLRPTPNMRLCIIRLQSGHEVLGKAQVLDSDNDIEEFGNSVALTNATNEIWSLVGSIAKAVM